MLFKVGASLSGTSIKLSLIGDHLIAGQGENQAINRKDEDTGSGVQAAS
jgi:hypothetical protein